MRARLQPDTHPFGRRAWSRRLLTGLVVVFFALAHLAVVVATPLAGGPRETVASYAPVERWSPPPPVRDARFATFPFVTSEGGAGLWVLPTAEVPLEFVVEREVVERFGETPVREAIESLNGTAGSRFAASVIRLVDAGVDERRRDRINRIFMDRRSCGGRYLARAHLWPGDVVRRDGLVARAIGEVDLGLCDRLRPEQMARVVRHELGHIAGLDHLCDEGEDCWHPDFEPQNTCRIMSPRAAACQELADGDRDGLVHLHPRLPRASGTDGRSTAASVAFATHPTPRSALTAVIVPHDAPLALRVAGATLAGHLRAPYLLVDENCTMGPDGQALDRVLAVAGTVQAVGPVAASCLATLRGAWALAVRELPRVRDVEDRVLEVLAERETPPSRLFVAPVDAPSRGTPVAAVAATAAVALDAPLTFVTDRDDAGSAVRLLEASPEIREVIVVADRQAAGLQVVLALAREGVTVRRVTASDASEAAGDLATFPGIPLPSSLPVAIASTEHPEHTIPAIALASHLGGLLVPIEPELRPAHVELLGDHADGGAVVGGRQAISTSRQIALSRLVDGVVDAEALGLAPD